MADELLSYGVLESRSLNDDIDAYLEEIDYRGYTVVDSGLNLVEIDLIRDSIDSNYDRQRSETAGVGMNTDADILRCPLAYDECFVKVATLELLMDICRRSFGQNFILMQQNAIINRPTTKEYQSRWHRDLAYQHFVVSKRLALNALLCVDDFTLETGGTVVLPTTHLFEEFPSPRFVKKHETTVNAKAGSILILDALLYHRSGFNVSGRDRRGVNHLIGRPLLVQQIDIPRVLDGRHENDPFLHRYLGYQWNPAPSVVAWRAARAQ